MPVNEHHEPWDIADISSVIDQFRSMTAEEILERGFSVRGNTDDIDDPILLDPNGRPVKTWREGYPYAKKLGRDEYEHQKHLLQIELLHAQRWLQDSGHKLVVLFEGRDAAGKGGSIKRFIEHLNPRGASVVALTVPSVRETHVRTNIDR